MKKITHYTDGYGGNLDYETYCQKKIDSHSDSEGATLDPKRVTCVNCKKTKEWKEDFNNQNLNSQIKRRIYLESDILHADELISSQREVSKLCQAKKVKFVRRVFTEILEFAWHDLDTTWKAVKNADEIYSDSSLMPLVGGSYMGAPVIFNGMCERAIKENVTGKEVYILRPLESIDWHMIKKDVMINAFKNNKLFMVDDGKIKEVDVRKVAKKK